MLIIGHRGARGLAPENTLASLQSALDTHVNMVEIDVRVTKDGTPVLSHDNEITASDGKKLAIDKTGFSDLQLAKSDLLTLEAALQFIDRRVDILLEIKPGQPIEPIADCIEPRISKPGQESDIILESYDFVLLSKMHATFPHLPVAVLEKWSGVRATYRARKLGTKRLVMNHRWLWSGFVASMSRRGYLLSCYTLNDPKRAKMLEKHGLYGCITDDPQKFLKDYLVEESK